MSNRHEGFRGAARAAAPSLVLRWAALFAVVLVWVLPVCTHAAGDAFSAATPVPGAVMSTAAIERVDGHVCPDTEHGPGDARCHPAAGAATSTVSPVAVPSPRAVDVTAALWAPQSLSARGAPGVRVHAPGIHQLQVQRV
ncbi:hypothetical protein [Streptomyces dysideae]|nr:hypothetical protein [Streptomyces dysideae]